MLPKKGKKEYMIFVSIISFTFLSVRSFLEIYLFATVNLKAPYVILRHSPT